ncbi:fumarylacetoacetate hydrolase family protein [Desulfopila sp. IMCC35008]|uniref:fumarylacetoacetate hydrolase family protein n=1 Tax=Desulfopila sp. IMCC35008 TaxID=2653858 RepID=UPI0013D69F6F|nr:fumarylacetoacetate hydrolase family protein [Desulfopila sp. IMCC35008]
MPTAEDTKKQGNLNPEREYAPSKIVCVGRNYVEHISELGNELPNQMVIFCKPNSAITDVLHAFNGERLHYEAEICYIIEAGKPVAVTCGLDLTKRELQADLKTKGLPWERAKGFDGSALFGPFVALEDIQQELTIELYVNGTLRQQGSTSMMLHKPENILREIGTVMTLDDGDIVMTGTPAGVGEVVAGDNYMARILAAGEEIISCSWLAV